MNRLTNHRKDGFLTPRMRRAVACFWIFCFTLSVACTRKEIDPEGTWRGFVKTVSGEQVAFTLDVKREQGRITGALVNGDERNVSTDGAIDGNTLTLRFNYYDGELIGK